MGNYPKINYIGNKNKLTDWIIDNFPVKSGRVLDLFCGGCSVSYALKEKGYSVIANDALYSNFVLAKAIIENNKILLLPKDFDKKVNEDELKSTYMKIKFLENQLYFPDEVKELAKLIRISASMKGYKKYMYLALIRRAMIRKIPYSRMNVPWNQIVKLRNEEYSYEKYKRRRAYHNYSFEKHVMDNLDNYNNAVFDNNQVNMAFNKDSFQMVKDLGDSVDVIYMDPPYPATMNKYGDFYGAYDKMLGKEKKYVNLSEDDKFLENFERLIKLCLKKTRYIVISENKKTKPSYLELVDILSKYGDVTVVEKNHQYKVTSKENKNDNTEVLLIVDTKK